MTLIVLASLLGGLLVCYNGYELFRGLLTLAGALAIGAFIASYCDSNHYGGFVTLIGFLVGAAIGGPLTFALYQVGVFFAGMYVGVLLAAYLQNGPPSTGVALFLALALGLVAIGLERAFIVLSTAFGGALAFVTGLSLMLAGSQISSPASLAAYVQDAQTTGHQLIWFLIWVLLGTSGASHQFKQLNAKKDESKEREGVKEDGPVVLWLTSLAERIEKAILVARTGRESREVKEWNLDRWIRSGGADQWVGQHDEGWSHQDWLTLLRDLQARGLWPMDEAALGEELHRVHAERRARRGPEPPPRL